MFLTRMTSETLIQQITSAKKEPRKDDKNQNVK